MVHADADADADADETLQSKMVEWAVLRIACIGGLVDSGVARSSIRLFALDEIKSPRGDHERGIECDRWS